MQGNSIQPHPPGKRSTQSPQEEDTCSSYQANPQNVKTNYADPRTPVLILAQLWSPIWPSPFANEHEQSHLGPFVFIDPNLGYQPSPLVMGIRHWESLLGPIGVINPSLGCQPYPLPIGMWKVFRDQSESLIRIWGANLSFLLSIRTVFCNHLKYQSISLTHSFSPQ